MSDLIDRQKLLKDIEQYHLSDGKFQHWVEVQPSVEPTLYGYKIELLAYIARVMEMEGITAEQAVNDFDDLCMAVRLITEEALQKFEEAVIDG